MGLVVFLVFGLTGGFFAGVLLPGFQKRGILAAIGQVVAGAVVGGFIGSICIDALAVDLNVGGLLGSMAGTLFAMALPNAPADRQVESNRRAIYRRRRFSEI